MRRHSRGSGGPAVVSKSAALGSDPMSLIRTFNSETNPSRPVRPSPLAASQIQGMPLDLIDRIRSFPLFQSTPESFLAEIGLHLRPQLNSTNDYILTEGDEAKAMYWLVRGAVAVTSRDGESVYAELKPGAFFGEIGVLMDRPRTATIIARTRCLLVVLTKDDFKKILPRFPEVEQTIREEAEERLLILQRKKKEPLMQNDTLGPHKRVTKRVRDAFSGSFSFDEDGRDSSNISKKRKSPSPGLAENSSSSALANGLVSVRLLLKELPLFAGLPSNILHFLGLNAQPRTYQPFTDIIRQDSQGREIYFIVRGEVEVLNEHPDGRGARRGTDAEGQREVQVKARLKAGQYFGEVVSLSLAPRRTATVRTVTSVECLMISEEVLSEFWDRCPPHIREQIESTARKRLVPMDGDVEMEDVATNTVPPMDELVINENFHGSVRRQSMPLLTLTETELDSPHKPTRIEDRPILKPSDPDPFLIIGLDNVRSRSRRGSLAPIAPDGSLPPQDQRQQSPVRPQSCAASPSKPTTSSILSSAISPKQSTTSHHASQLSKCYLNDDILVSIFQHLELHYLLRLRVISRHWSNIITKSPLLLHFLDLSRYNRKLTDDILSNIICPFIGDRPRSINMNNCFHITDEGFKALANACGGNLISLKMKSVWDVTASAILDMANKAKCLQEIDLSNCRKVSDTLLARIVGWTVPNPPFGQHFLNGKSVPNATWAGAGLAQNTTPQNTPASGTVVGCPRLKRLALSYCKHVTDNSMFHIASHAASRLEEVDLTRCTTITDKGFQFWGNAQFLRLRKLCLADCTYLTDNAIVYLTNAAKGLQELDLSFCCALSDTATEVLALGCPQLTHLNLSFCGSAVSDPSLRSIGLHLLLLQELSVRGCVRVTGTGVESVLDGCNLLRVFDVSQCKNLTPWLEYGFHRKYGDKIRYETISKNGKLIR
ncbi:hypothetical protein ACJ73_00993 [Blastomyces percursus]|uniref:Cyclic nucleotide-binding domain-containing protein n=1 Tax=Blastomyces percursus TaxID=1658174 RepID=A0A1J9QFK1_9EURO|nr:hypothetical protein ACJ73_00993 [Blastomyces percursus]